METAYSDHSYSDQLLIWIKKLGTESFLYKCCLNEIRSVTDTFINNVESTGEIKEHDSHSAALLLQV